MLLHRNCPALSLSLSLVLLLLLAWRPSAYSYHAIKRFRFPAPRRPPTRTIHWFRVVGLDAAHEPVAELRAAVYRTELMRRPPAPPPAAVRGPRGPLFGPPEALPWQFLGPRIGLHGDPRPPELVSTPGPAGDGLTWAEQDTLRRRYARALRLDEFRTLCEYLRAWRAPGPRGVAGEHSPARTAREHSPDGTTRARSPTRAAHAHATGLVGAWQYEPVAESGGRRMRAVELEGPFHENEAWRVRPPAGVLRLIRPDHQPQQAQGRYRTVSDGSGASQSGVSDDLPNEGDSPRGGEGRRRQRTDG